MDKQEFIDKMTEFTHLGLMPSPICVNGLADYIYDKVPTGGFLRSILENDLVGACMRADDHNLRNLPVYVAILYNYVPSQCWGDKEKVKKWLGEL